MDFLSEEDREQIRNSKILVVDDFKFIRTQVEVLFEEFGAEVRSAGDGYEAVNIAKEFNPDVILLDIVMQKIDGFETSRRIKQIPHLKNTPIIFLTALSDKKNIIKGFNMGGVDYIVKPFDKEELIMRVLTHIKLAKLRFQIEQKNAMLERAIEAAAKIQQALLPKSLPNVAELDIDYVFKPALKVAGDILNVFRLDEDHIGFYVVDVEGKGIEAAMISVSISEFLNPVSIDTSPLKYRTPDGYRIASPGEVLLKLNREFPFERFKKFFSISYGVINFRTGELRWTKSLVPGPILITHNKALMLGLKNPPVGLFDKPKFKESTLKLKKNDTIIFYTDGAFEQVNKSNEEVFGIKRLLRVTISKKYSTVSSLLDDIISAIENFSQTQNFQDDITILGIRYRGKS